MSELIICAAVRISGHIFRGNRHHDCISSARRYFGDEADVSEPRDEGFITSTGRYVDREKARKIHEASGAKPFHGEYHDETRLFSEDLY